MAQDVATVDTASLPPRSVPERIAPRPVLEWVRTHFRVGHLPGSLPMADAFLKAGYNVVTLNALGRWDIVGPSASLYPPERVKDAEEYLRTDVEQCHKAGAKAVIYVGPVQVAVGNPAFAKVHPDWLRILPDGKPDAEPNFANIRSGYADWLLAQLAYVTRTFRVDGFWFEGYAPVHLHFLAHAGCVSRVHGGALASSRAHRTRPGICSAWRSSHTGVAECHLLVRPCSGSDPAVCQAGRRADCLSDYSLQACRASSAGWWSRASRPMPARSVCHLVRIWASFSAVL
jgi:hypothetical protein